MSIFSRGRYDVTFTQDPKHIAAAQRLRLILFRNNQGEEEDGFDARCTHVLVHDKRSGTLVCTFRFLALTHGRDIGLSYSAQYYELSALEGFDGPIVEMGRFCIHPDYTDPDIVRIAWGAMAQYVDENGIELLFGCSSFQGTEAAEYMDAFALLKERHLAPSRWLPKVKAPRVFRFARHLGLSKPNLRAAMQAMPPLLRTYLMMGGWVSDHAVVDTDLNTLHVFTGLEVRAVPENRKQLLRAIAP